IRSVAGIPEGPPFGVAATATSCTSERAGSRRLRERPGGAYSGHERRGGIEPSGARTHSDGAEHRLEVAATHPVSVAEEGAATRPAPSHGAACSTPGARGGVDGVGGFGRRPDRGGAPVPRRAADRTPGLPAAAPKDLERSGTRTASQALWRPLCPDDSGERHEVGSPDRVRGA